MGDLGECCEGGDRACGNRAVVGARIQSGAFDGTGAMRGARLGVLEEAIELGQEAQRDRRAGQITMFGDFESHAAPAPPVLVILLEPPISLLRVDSGSGRYRSPEYSVLIRSLS